MLAKSKRAELDAYLAVLEWIEIADAAHIRNALDLSHGAAREDLELGIKSIMLSERQGLMAHFPELLPPAPRLAELAQVHENLAKALRDLRTCALIKPVDSLALDRRYRVAARCLSALQHQHIITPPARESLLIELAAIKSPQKRAT